MPRPARGEFRHFVRKTKWLTDARKGSRNMELKPIAIAAAVKLALALLLAMPAVPPAAAQQVSSVLGSPSTLFLSEATKRNLDQVRGCGVIRGGIAPYVARQKKKIVKRRNENGPHNDDAGWALDHCRVCYRRVGSR